MSRTESVGKTFTQVDFHACSREQLDQEMHEYILQYPPAGYATTIRKPPRPDAVGCWEARFERYTSCE